MEISLGHRIGEMRTKGKPVSVKQAIQSMERIGFYKRIL